MGILREFPDFAHCEEFEVADGQALGFEKKVTQVRVPATPPCCTWAVPDVALDATVAITCA
jgi:hypothetical protein